MEQRGLQEYTWTGRGGPFELLVSEEVFAPTHTSADSYETLDNDHSRRIEALRKSL